MAPMDRRAHAMLRGVCQFRQQARWLFLRLGIGRRDVGAAVGVGLERNLGVQVTLELHEDVQECAALHNTLKHHFFYQSTSSANCICLLN